MKKIIIISSILIFLLFSCNNISENKNIKQLDSVNRKWLGTWSYTKRFRGAEIDITKIIGDSIEFSMNASNGGNSGEISGKAKVKGNVAEFINIEYGDTCEMNFELKADSIIIHQKSGICGAGLDVYYGGVYLNDKLSSDKTIPNTTLVSLEILKNNKEDSEFKKLVGKDYELFVESSQSSSDDSDMDNFGAKVISSGVAGLYTEEENIIMITDKYKIWAAVIEDSCVNYYSTDDGYKNKLPKTIENWRSRFLEKKIIYKSQ
jgi:hypothetical protein